MAEPIIIIKENPGTLLIEVLDHDSKPVTGSPFRCPGVAFSMNSELEVEGSKFKPKKVGNVAEVRIKIKTSSAAGG